MIELELSVGGNKVKSIKIDRMTRQMVANMKRGINNATQLVERHIKYNQLSGQALRVQTGFLRSSFHATPAVEVRPKEVGGTVKSRAPYAAIHEFGFDGMETVRAHTRRGQSGMFAVREHERHMRVRPKWYAKKTLKSGAPKIVEYISKAIMRPLA